MAKTRDPNAPAVKQPQSTPEMIVPSSSGDPPAQTGLEDQGKEEGTAAEQGIDVVAKGREAKAPPLA